MKVLCLNTTIRHHLTNLASHGGKVLKEKC